jgi:hypothetical protein
MSIHAPYVPAAEREEWHPKLQRLYEYWAAIRPGGRRLPGRQHLDPADIPRDLLPFIWMLDIQREPFRIRYRLIGTKIVAGMGRNPTGMWVDEAHPHVLDRPEFFSRFQKVVKTGIPSRRSGIPTIWLSDAYLFENLVLPFAADGENPDMLVILTVMFFQTGKEREIAF